MPLSLRPLAWSRLALGAVFLARTTPAARLFRGVLVVPDGPLLGWPDPGVWRVAALDVVLPDSLVKVACVVRTVAALLFLVGLYPRTAGVVAFATAALVATRDPFGYIFTLQSLLLGVLVLALADSSTCLAVRPEPPRAPRSSLWLVHGFVASIYAWSAIAKARGPWLADTLLGGATARKACAWTVVGMELALGPALLWARTRTVALVGACLMHAVFELTTRPDLFTWVMGALLLSFVSARDD